MRDRRPKNQPDNSHSVEIAKNTAFGSIRLALFYAVVPLLVLICAVVMAGLIAYLVIAVFEADLSYRTLLKKLSQILLLASVFPMLWLMNLKLADIGVAPKSVLSRQIGKGLLLGFVTLSPVFVLFFFLDIHVVDHTQPWTLRWLGKKLVLDLLLSLLISIFEEPVFRGMLLTGLGRKMASSWAIGISAFYYAGLHFMNSQTQIPVADLTPWSSLQLLSEAFANIFSPNILPAFFALFAVGVFLGSLRTKIPMSLGYCIGCHTCWVWLIKLNKSFFNINPDSDYLFLVSSYDGVIGPLITVWLGLAVLVFFLGNSHKSGQGQS